MIVHCWILIVALLLLVRIRISSVNKHLLYIARYQRALAGGASPFFLETNLFALNIILLVIAASAQALSSIVLRYVGISLVQLLLLRMVLLDVGRILYGSTPFIHVQLGR